MTAETKGLGDKEPSARPISTDDLPDFWSRVDWSVETEMEVPSYVTISRKTREAILKKRGEILYPPATAEAFSDIGEKMRLAVKPFHEVVLSESSEERQTCISNLKNLRDQLKVTKDNDSEVVEYDLMISRLENDELFWYVCLNADALNWFESLKARDMQTYLYILGASQGSVQAVNTLLCEAVVDGRLDDDARAIGLSIEEVKAILDFNKKASPVLFSIFAKSLQYRSVLEDRIPSQWARYHEVADDTPGAMYVASYQEGAESYLLPIGEFFGTEWKKLPVLLREFSDVVRTDVSEVNRKRRWNGFEEYIGVLCRALQSESLDPAVLDQAYYEVFQKMRQLAPDFREENDDSDSCRVFFIPTNYYDETTGWPYLDFRLGLIGDSEMAIGRKLARDGQMTQYYLDAIQSEREGIIAQARDKVIPPIYPMDCVGPFGQCLETSSQGEVLLDGIYLNPEMINMRTRTYRIPFLIEMGLLDPNDKDRINRITHAIVDQFAGHERFHKVVGEETRSVLDETKAETGAIAVNISASMGRVSEMYAEDRIAGILAECFYNIAGSSPDVGSLGANYFYASVIILDALTSNLGGSSEDGRPYLFTKPNGGGYGIRSVLAAYAALGNMGHQILRDNYIYSPFDETSPTNLEMARFAQERLKNNPTLHRLVFQEIPRVYSRIKPWENHSKKNWNQAD